MTPSRSQIRSWVLAARAGDRAALEQLHRSAAPVVRGVLMARGGSAELEDRVHDVFVLALSRLPQLADPAAFMPWIVTIARRHAGPSRPPMQPLLVDVAVHDSPRAEAERILARICTLPECYAEPLTLRLVFGMSGAEIADTLDLSPAYVRVNLHRGMRRLRRSLGLDAHGNEPESNAPGPEHVNAGDTLVPGGDR